MKLHQTALAISALSASLLAGCGGGSASVDAPAVPTQMAAMQTYITDNLTTDYTKVWVGITDISLVDDKGVKTSVFASATPAIFNLSSLASVSRFMSQTNIAPGHYVKAQVTLDDKVQLVARTGGTTTNAVLKGDGTTSTIVLDIDTNTNIEKQLVLDFNLASFTYDAASNKVVPAIEKSHKKGGDATDFDRNVVEVAGTVVSNDSKELVIKSEKHGDNVHIVLGTSTGIVSEDGGKVLSSKDIVVGSHVEATGTITSTSVITVDTKTIEVRPATVKPTEAPALVRGTGRVVSMNGGMANVLLDEASFLPGANTIVVDTSKATFTHGALSDLVAGVSFVFRGTRNGALVMATAIEIKGAPSVTEHVASDAKFATLYGVVKSINGSVAEMTVHTSTSDGTTTGKFDLSTATFNLGRLACVVPGKELTMAGTLTANGYTVREVTMLHGCDAPVVN